MLGYPISKPWGDLLVGAKGLHFSEDPWNTQYTLLPDEKLQGLQERACPSRCHALAGPSPRVGGGLQGQGPDLLRLQIGGPLTELMQLANLATLSSKARSTTTR